ncbi:bifunctional 5,10-methylenetetrahydrofolate dehydrogenase/5,10-methenyltetrahydrofolate cyclohydrolase [Syntrophomonas erecta]
MDSPTIVSRGNLLRGKTIANEIMEQVTKEACEIKSRGLVPFLMTIEVGKDPATEVYLESQRRVARKAGINYETISLSSNTSQERLLSIIASINRDKIINGLIVHMPLPAHIDNRSVQWSINPKKDVEGVTPHNIGRLVLGGEGLAPCTALAIVELIKSTGTDIRGREVTIVGYSDIVGKPAAIMLLKEEATVSICHYATYERGHLEQHVRDAEILVVAVGKPGLIKGEWIREGAIVIDAGINTVGGRLVGDVEYNSARDKASYITPVPGGVGVVTVAYLMRNTIEAMHWQLRA